jgi:hypothetical protein
MNKEMVQCIVHYDFEYWGLCGTQAQRAQKLSDWIKSFFQNQNMQTLYNSGGCLDPIDDFKEDFIQRLTDTSVINYDEPLSPMVETLVEIQSLLFTDNLNPENAIDTLDLAIAKLKSIPDKPAEIISAITILTGIVEDLRPIRCSVQ